MISFVWNSETRNYHHYILIYLNFCPHFGFYSTSSAVLSSSILQVSVVASLLRISNWTLYSIHRANLFWFHCQCLEDISNRLILSGDVTHLSLPIKLTTKLFALSKACGHEFDPCYTDFKRYTHVNQFTA